MSATTIRRVLGADTTNTTERKVAVSQATLTHDADNANIVRALNNVQSSLGRITTAVQTLPIMGGVYIKDQVIQSTTTIIEHKLGVAVSYIITNLRGSGTPAVKRDADTDETRFLNLIATGACTVDLWIFPRP